MFYENLNTGEFGITLYDASVQSNTTVPEGTMEFAYFRGYEFSPIPDFDRLTQGIREIAPVDGIQQWEVYTLSSEEAAIMLESHKTSHNYPILQQIEDLERQQIRPQGEILTAMLNGTTPNQFAVDKLQQIEDAKAALRVQLL